MRKFTVLLLVILATLTLSAQKNEEPFQAYGKPVIKVFTNWHQGVGNSDFEDNSGFELSRGVLGYEHFFSSHISSKVIIDVDDPGAGKFTEAAYMRNAYIAYNNDKLSAYFGILGMKQFKEQENNWGYRYIYKSAMDHYKFNNSVDAGFYVKYKVLDWLSADVTLTNGEGAKSQQDVEGKYRTGYGLTFKPIDGLTFRGYYDVLYSPGSTPGNVTENQNALALFIGYKADNLRVGAEYNKLLNYKYDVDDDRKIYSVYASYKFLKDFQAFVRYDIFSAEESGLSEDVIMAGLEYSIVKGVKVSPNFRYGNYAFKSAIPTGQGAFFYLNFEYKF